jgi:hypothetical protein
VYAVQYLVRGFTRMKDSLLIAYGCIGIATLILFAVYRVKRGYRLKRKDDPWLDPLLGWIFAHEFMMLLFAALWPVFLPLLLLSLMRSRGDHDDA